MRVTYLKKKWSYLPILHDFPVGDGGIDPMTELVHFEICYLADIEGRV